MSKTESRRVVGAERRLEILRLRKQGLTFQEIGVKVGVSRQRAGKVVIDEITKLARLSDREAEVAAHLELERLDALTFALWPKCISGDTKAVDSMLRVMSRRAALLGLDKPTKSEVTMTQTTDSELLSLADQFGLPISDDLRKELSGEKVDGESPQVDPDGENEPDEEDRG